MSVFNLIINHIPVAYFPYIIYIMSNNKKNSSSSFLGKIAIGLVGVVGGLLIGKALDQAIKK